MAELPPDELICKYESSCYRVCVCDWAGTYNVCYNVCTQGVKTVTSTMTLSVLNWDHWWLSRTLLSSVELGEWQLSVSELHRPQPNSWWDAFIELSSLIFILEVIAFS